MLKFMEINNVCCKTMLVRRLNVLQYVQLHNWTIIFRISTIYDGFQ
jgi:hypothetical protein